MDGQDLRKLFVYLLNNVIADCALILYNQMLIVFLQTFCVHPKDLCASEFQWLSMCIFFRLLFSVNIQNILWNLHQHYRQFTVNVAGHINKQKSPIEKQLKVQYPLVTV